MLKINKQYDFEKTGINEVEGLKEVLLKSMAPMLAFVKDKTYWNDDLELSESEYKSRDGFIPYRENCGGIELTCIIPKCEEYDWSFLEFGECDQCGTPDLGLDRHGLPKQCGYNGDSCGCESDGHLDAKFRVWLKFEGLDDGVMSFYLYCGGGNGDAPYFRVKAETTVFEESFQGKTLKQVQAQAVKAVKKLLKQLGK